MGCKKVRGAQVSTNDTPPPFGFKLNYEGEFRTLRLLDRDLNGLAGESTSGTIIKRAFLGQ